MQDVGSKENTRYAQRDRSADDERPSVNPLDSVSLLEDRNGARTERQRLAKTPSHWKQRAN
jgi:hypothetical protein